MHKCKEVTELREKLNIKFIFNAAYSPDYNPAEGAISVVKGLVKKWRLQAIVNETEADIEQMIKEAALKLKNEGVNNMI